MSFETNAVTTSIIPQWNQKLLFDILNNIHEVVLVLDAQTTIVYANEAYAKILGVPVQKVLGRRLIDIEPNTEAIEVLRTGKAVQGRNYLSSVGINVVGITFPLFEDEKIIGCTSIFNNISEVVRLNREIQITQGVADYFKEQLDQFNPLPLSFQDYIGQNSKIRETLYLAAKVAKTESTVLIRGESGVGKDVLAKAIHNCSSRQDKPLIKVNCAAIPENLLESELFGYEDGAFTGAKKGGKLGRFELAHGGTIFLDEIGDMSTSMQAKLLRVLQDKEFERVGGNNSIKVNIRVIAATNRDLEKMIEEGTFRRDLFYRLNIVPLYLPPLRERKNDISALANYFLDRLSQDVGVLTMSPEVMRILHSYDWPGNVRELQNVLEHASIICDGTIVEPGHLPAYLYVTQEEILCARQNPCALKKALNSYEKDLIITALANSNNNRTGAMRALGISRRSFYDKLQKYSID